MILLLCVLLLFSPSLQVKKFRSEKINYIYEKAINHIDQKKLGKLSDDLEKYDKVYMSTKELHAHGKASDLNRELTKVDKKLVDLLEKYDLQQTVQAFKQKIKHRSEYDEERHDGFLTEKFADDRIQKLWDAAKEGEFSEKQMKELYKELKEVERKTSVYEDVLQQFNKIPNENSVHFDEERHVEDNNRKLKEAHKDVYDHLEQVEARISGKVGSPFENEKVRKMWKIANSNGNFSQHDLQVIKDELVHFDKQLRKLEYHKSELDARREGREKEGKTTLEHLENTELDAKHEKMDRKLRKLEKYLETKIVHSEL